MFSFTQELFGNYNNEMSDNHTTNIVFQPDINSLMPLGRQKTLLKKIVCNLEPDSINIRHLTDGV